MKTYEDIPKKKFGNLKIWGEFENLKANPRSKIWESENWESENWEIENIIMLFPELLYKLNLFLREQNSNMYKCWIYLYDAKCDTDHWSVRWTFPDKNRTCAYAPWIVGGYEVV